MKRTASRFLFMALISGFLMYSSSVAMAADTNRIGALFPFTGSMALLGQETFNGATIAADMSNEKGGIFGKKTEWVKADAVDPKKAITECERLISIEKLKVILGTYASSLSYPASEVAERNKVIYWEATAIADAITERGFKYIFRSLPRASDFGIMAVDTVHQLIAPKLGIDPKKIKIGNMFEDSLFGTTVQKSVLKQASKLGMNVVASESYSAKTVDLSPIVMRFKDQKPDVIIASCYIEDGLLFWRQAKDLNLNVKALIGTAAVFCMADWARTFGKEGDYVFAIAEPFSVNPKIYDEKTKAVRKEFHERFNKKFGQSPGDHATLGFVAARVLFEEVLPRAGSLDPEAVRKAALQVDIPDGGTILGYGVKYAPSDHPLAGQNLRARVVLLQWQDQELWVVDPENWGLKKPLMPMPTWEERAKGITRFVK